MQQAGNPITQTICNCACLFLILALEATVAIWALVLRGNLDFPGGWDPITAAGCKVGGIHSGLLVNGILTLILMGVQVVSNIMSTISGCVKWAKVRDGAEPGEANTPVTKLLDALGSMAACIILGVFIAAYVFICLVYDYQLQCGKLGAVSLPVHDRVKAWAITALILGTIDLCLVVLVCVCLCCAVVCMLGLLGGALVQGA